MAHGAPILLPLESEQNKNPSLCLRGELQGRFGQSIYVDAFPADSPERERALHSIQNGVKPHISLQHSCSNLITIPQLWWGWHASPWGWYNHWHFWTKSKGGRGCVGTAVDSAGILPPYWWLLPQQGHLFTSSCESRWRREECAHLLQDPVNNTLCFFLAAFPRGPQEAAILWGECHFDCSHVYSEWCMYLIF